MVVEHIVFVQLDEPYPSENFEEQLKGLVATFKDQIPGVIEASFGRNISPNRAQGFTHALRVLMTDKEALAVYAPHPVHQHFVSSIAPVRKNLICIDYERE